MPRRKPPPPAPGAAPPAPLSPSTEPLALVVGIGSSAGGLEALSNLLAHLPAQSRMSYIIAQHLSPSHESLLVQLLGRETRLRVVEIEDGMVIEPNTVYVTPANNHVSLVNRQLRLSLPGARPEPKPSVDFLFSSIAEDQAERAVGIVLSGTGSDGAQGIRAIHAAGGLTFAQDEGSARYSGMPLAAVNTQCVDFVLSPEEIARKLTSIADLSIQLDHIATDGPAPTAYERIMAHLLRHTGQNFLNYKPTTVQRRLMRRMTANQLTTLEQYEALVLSDPTEAARLAREMYISVTSFFRDPSAYSDLEAHIEAIVAKKQANDEIRAWVAACASGEEAYSLAILLHEAVARSGKRLRVQVFATDADEAALTRARKGVYPMSIAQKVPPATVQTWFTEAGGHLHVAKVVRERVIFSRHDLTRDPPFLRLDLVSCRNLLIYLTPPAQTRLLELFHFALRSGGVLFLGKSESLGARTSQFGVISEKNRIYRRLDGPPRRITELRRPAELPGDADTTARPQRADADPLADRVLAALVGGAMPPGVLIDDALALRRVYGDVARFLQFRPGVPQLNLAGLLPVELRLEVQSLVSRARRDGATHTAQTLLTTPDRQRTRLTVTPVAGAHPEERLFLVLLDAETTATRPARGRASSALDRERVGELEGQLQASRENLRTVVEELETSNEELQSLNEELQSANEELQSTNEEMETANEELQSTNEELTTVNEEMEAKTSELLTVNADLRNIKDSVGFPMFVVDGLGRLTLYNRQAELLLGASEAHLGHSILALPSTIDTSLLKEQAAHVVAAGTPTTIQVKGSSCFLVQTQPYRDGRNQLRGAVISLVDNTDIIDAHDRLERQSTEVRESERLIRTTLNAFRKHVCVIGHDGTIRYVNDAWVQFGAENGARTDGVGENYLTICARAADAGDGTAARALAGIHSVLDGSANDFRMECPCSSMTEERWFVLNVHAIGGQTPWRAVISHEDVTQARLAARQVHLQSRALDASLNGILICQPMSPTRLAIVHANSGFTRMTGYTLTDLLGADPLSLLTEGAPSEPTARIRDAMVGLHTHRGITLHRRNDNSSFWVDISVCPVAGEGLSPDCVVAVYTDVSEAVANTERIAASLAREQAALAFARVGSFSWDLGTNLVQHSLISLDLWGLPREPVERPYADLHAHLHPHSIAPFDEAVRLCEAGIRSLDVEVRIVHDEGAVRWVHVRGDVVQASPDAPKRLVGLCQDITERRETEERIRHVAHHDALTGLPNRTLLRDRLQQALLTARRTNHRVGVLFVDLDQFKTINDSLGHQAGDRLLQSVARRLLRCVRESDTVCRTGGDEYVIVLPELADTSDPGHVARKIVRVLSEPHHLDGHEVVATPSVGIAVFPEDGTTIDALLRNADAAMYHAKEAGRANYQYFTEALNARLMENVSVKSDLRRALREGQFRVHYQPQYTIANRQMVGAEALIRWEHPERGMVRPDQFIPIAEESDLILDIGDWVLNEVCRQNQAWMDAGLAVLPVAVNFSPNQFRRGRLMESVTGALKATSLPPNLLELELTERTMMRRPEEAATLVEALKGLGIGLSLDDFGVGYSNLSFLKRLPFDRLKIDMSLVRGLPENAADRAIAKAIIDMGHSLGLRVLAEGVERKEELDILRGAGCDEFQGYHGSVVLDAARYASLLPAAEA